MHTVSLFSFNMVPSGAQRKEKILHCTCLWIFFPCKYIYVCPLLFQHSLLPGKLGYHDMPPSLNSHLRSELRNLVTSGSIELEGLMCLSPSQTSVCI